MKPEKVSIISAVYNEEKTFAEHLDSLLRQTYPSFEIIIVNDGSTDATSTIAKAYQRRHPRLIHYYHIDHKPGYGCVRPRLYGVSKAKGSILCIVEGDGSYAPDYLAQCFTALITLRADAVVPQMQLWKPQTLIARYRDILYKLRFRDPAIIQKRIQQAQQQPFFIRRKAYKVAGGYNIRDAYCEDTELVKRLLHHGATIVYAPKAHWYHKVEETVSAVCTKNFSIGSMNARRDISQPKTLLKHVYFLSPFLFFLVGFFSSFFWILLLLHPLPLIAYAFLLYIRSFGIHGHYLVFLGPFISYFTNISRTLGFLSFFLLGRRS